MPQEKTEQLSLDFGDRGKARKRLSKSRLEGLKPVAPNLAESLIGVMVSGKCAEAALRKVEANKGSIGSEEVYRWLGRLLPHSPDSEHISGSGRVDSPAAALLCLETVEEAQEPRARPVESSGVSRRSRLSPTPVLRTWAIPVSTRDILR
jgi:hypothetical protein